MIDGLLFSRKLAQPGIAVAAHLQNVILVQDSVILEIELDYVVSHWTGAPVRRDPVASAGHAQAQQVRAPALLLLS